MLFDDKLRSFTGPKAYAEGDFEYLDRSARKEACNVRDFLNEWVSHFPDNESAELISRIKSGNRKAFESATFEIVLFGIVSGMGCTLEVHPTLDNGSDKKPDFLVKTPSGENFYLEAVLASEFSEAQQAAERRKNVVLDTIEKLESQYFYLGIKAEGNPDTPPPGKKLRHELSNWLQALDPDIVHGEVEEGGYGAIPTMVWEHNGWNVEFEAIPISPERRGKTQQVIGMLSGGARYINGWEPIRGAMRAKGGRYGEFNQPFVIAVNVDAFSLDRIDEMQALFGQEQFVFNRANPQGQPEMRRASNGAWNGPKGPSYTRVSGAWLFGGMNPWNIASRKNTFYFNPWAQNPAPSLFTLVNHAAANNGKMEWVDGGNLQDLLALTEYWPE